MKPHRVYTIFQQDDGMFPVNDKQLTETELNKLILITADAARWIIVKNPLVDLFAEIQDPKFRESVERYLNGDIDPEDLRTGRDAVIGAWILNNSRGNDERICASPGVIDIAKLSDQLLRKICAGAKLNEVDKEELVKSTFNQNLRSNEK